MKKQLLSVLVLFSLLPFIECGKKDPGNTAPTPSAAKGIVKGIVYDENNKLLSDATVSISGNNISQDVKTVAGQYMFPSLSTGTYKITAAKTGYIETTSSVSVQQPDTTFKDLILKTGTAFFNVLSDSLLIVSPYEKNILIKIVSNTGWVISSSDSWLIPSLTAGSGEDSVKIKITASTLDTTRQGLLLLQAGSFKRTITIRQLPNVVLRSVTAIPGNLALNIADSIALQFNQPVTVQSLFPGNQYCQSAIGYTYSGNKITYSYACADIGGDYPFTLSTKNVLGDQFTFTYTAGFYSKIFSFTGYILDYFVTDSDNSYWVMASHPNALYKIDMTTFELKNKYDLPAEPLFFSVSPYDNRIYLAYKSVPKLYILNQQGVTEKIIDIPNDTVHGFRDYIYPAEIAFAKNGKGLLGLSSLTYYYYWHPYFIDAADNHRIWYSKNSSEPFYLLNPAANWDKTKIIATGINHDPTIFILDCDNMNFSTYKPKNLEQGNGITVSRTDDKIYYIPSRIVNPFTGFEATPANIGSTAADFRYNNSNPLTFYNLREGRVELIDLSVGKSPISYSALQFQDITNTVDGKYLILGKHDGNYNAKVVQVPASWFNY